jgi:DNA-binding NarL/FixJ family response regulator
MFFKDQATARKLKDFEYAIEELNKQIFILQKKQKNDTSKDLKETLKQEILKEFDTEIKNVLVKEIKDLIDRLVETLNTLRQNLDTTKEDLELRIERLEEKTKEYMSMPTTATIDENRVKALFKAGYKKEEIARELHTSVGEVSFVLNILNLRG